MQQFRRDANGALINSDKGATAAYKRRRERTKKLESDINTLNTKVQELESIINTILQGIHVNN